MAGTIVGTVAEVWRYPVKSMGGERVSSAVITEGGLAGDRGWALYDDDAGQVRNAKLLPRLLQYTARYTSEPGSSGSAPVAISTPEGATLDSGDIDGASAALTAALGKNLRLSALRPASDTDHYRRGKPDYEDRMEQAMRSYALEEGEPLPSAAGMASLPGLAQLREFATPPGTYFDVAPLHLVTTSALDELARLNPAADADGRRFRANIVVRTGTPGFAEFDWCDRQLSIGALRLDIKARTLRCAMTTHAQPGIERAPSVMRTLVRETGQDFGVYALIAAAGEVREGDAVVLGG
jgi:hypothetical protein